MTFTRHLAAGLLAILAVGATLAPTRASGQADDTGSESLYSKVQKGYGQVDKTKPLARFVTVKRYWAGHDGVMAYQKVKLKGIPTPADIRAADPDAVYSVTLSAAQEVDENGQPAILGFVIGDLVVTATETRIETVTDDFNTGQECDVEFVVDAAKKTITGSGHWTCMPGYAPPADGADSYATVFASVQYEDPSEHDRKQVADSVSFTDVT